MIVLIGLSLAWLPLMATQALNYSIGKNLCAIDICSTGFLELNFQINDSIIDNCVNVTKNTTIKQATLHMNGSRIQLQAQLIIDVDILIITDTVFTQLGDHYNPLFINVSKYAVIASTCFHKLVYKGQKIAQREDNFMFSTTSHESRLELNTTAFVGLNLSFTGIILQQDLTKFDGQYIYVLDGTFLFSRLIHSKEDSSSNLEYFLIQNNSFQDTIIVQHDREIVENEIVAFEGGSTFKSLKLMNNKFLSPQAYNISHIQQLMLSPLTNKYKLSQLINVKPTTLFQINHWGTYRLKDWAILNNEISTDTYFYVITSQQTVLKIKRMKIIGNSFACIDLRIVNVKNSYELFISSLQFSKNLNNCTTIKESITSNLKILRSLYLSGKLLSLSPKGKLITYILQQYGGQICQVNQAYGSIDYPIQLINCLNCNKVTLIKAVITLPIVGSFQFFLSKQIAFAQSLSLDAENINFKRQMQGLNNTQDLPILQVEGSFTRISLNNSNFTNLSYMGYSVFQIVAIDFLSMATSYFISFQNIVLNHLSIDYRINYPGSVFYIRLQFPQYTIFNNITIFNTSINASEKYLPPNHCTDFLDENITMPLMVNSSENSLENEQYIISSIFDIFSPSGQVTLRQISIVKIEVQGTYLIRFDGKAITIDSLRIRDLNNNQDSYQLFQVSTQNLSFSKILTSQVVLQMGLFMKSTNIRYIKFSGVIFHSWRIKESSTKEAVLIVQYHPSSTKEEFLNYYLIITEAIFISIYLPKPSTDSQQTDKDYEHHIVMIEDQSCTNLTIFISQVTVEQVESFLGSLFMIAGSYDKCNARFLKIEQIKLTGYNCFSLLSVSQFTLLSLENIGIYNTTILAKNLFNFRFINKLVVKKFVYNQTSSDQKYSLFSIIQSKIQFSFIKVTRLVLIGKPQLQQLLSIHQSFFTMNNAYFWNTMAQCVQSSNSTIKMKAIQMINSTTDNNPSMQFQSSNVSINLALIVNSTSTGFGGIIHYQQYQNENFIITLSFIYDNKARTEAGLAYFSNQPLVFQGSFSKSTNTDFTSRIVSNIVTYPKGIIIQLLDEIYSVEFCQDFSRNKQLLLKGVRPGQFLNLNFSMFYYNTSETMKQQVAYPFESFAGSLDVVVSGKTTVLNPEFYQTSQRYQIQQSIVLKPSVDQGYVNLTFNFSQTIQSWNRFSRLSIIQIKITFRVCVYGERIIESECHQCSEGLINYDIESESCIPCPNERAYCSNGKIYQLKDGFWRESEASPTLYQCTNYLENCIRHKESPCSKGLIGPLCESCDFFNENGEGSFFKQKNYICQPCDRQSEVEVVISSIILFFLVQTNLFFITKNGLISAVRVWYLGFINFLHMGVSGLRQLSGIFIKIMIGHIQMFQTLSALNIENHSNFSDMLSSIAISTQIVNLSSISPQCALFKNAEIHDQFPIIWFVVQSTMLLGFILFLIVLQMILDYKQYKRIILKHILFVLVSQYLFFFQSFANELISLLSCREIGKNSYLSNYMMYKCFTKQHHFNVWTMILPIIFLALFVLPAIYLYLMRKGVQEFKSYQIYTFLVQFGIITQDYKRQNYYFEFIKLAQKLGLLFIVNVFVSYPRLRVLLMIQWMNIYQYLVWHFQPYIRKEIQQFDKASTFIMITSLIFILIQLETDRVQVRLAFQLTWMLANIIFIQVIATKIISIMILKNISIIEFIIKKVSSKGYLGDFLTRCVTRKNPIKSILTWKKVYRQITLNNHLAQISIQYECYVVSREGIPYFDSQVINSQ